MYRIVKEKNEREIRYTVQKNKKWIIPWKWHDCKIEVFVGAGTVVYKASFPTKKDAEEYIEHKGSMVNGLIIGHPFYVD